MGTLSYQLSARQSGDKVCYILANDTVPQAKLDELAARYGVSFVNVYGFDWDNDLTPWPAPGVPKGTAPFKGFAPDLLTRLTGTLVPSAERALGLTGAERTLAGISLSGLFATWQFMSDTTFANIISISGSFWYEGFVQWIEKAPFATRTPGAKAYFSLGVEEPRSSNRIFATVGQCTPQVVDTIRRHGVYTCFQWNPGDHYAPFEPRLIRALNHIYGHGTAVSH